MHDVIIIGGGPAGLTAGLYAGRYRLDTLLLEKAALGGQIIMSSLIDNYPGFPGGISTSELAGKMEKQARDTGIQVQNGEVLGFEPQPAGTGGGFKIKTAENEYSARSVIIASGARWKLLGIPGEEKLVGRGVSFCATCDAPFFRNKEVVVVGGGDKAVEEAVFLTSYASRVTIIHRRKDLRATAIIQEKARANPRINFILDSVVDEVTGESKVESVKVRNLITGQSGNVPCQGVFIFIGISPLTGFIKNSLETDEAGFIITDNKMKSSLDGVFACGDCRQKTLYQVVTACGEAAQAAFSAHNYLLQSK